MKSSRSDIEVSAQVNVVDIKHVSVKADSREGSNQFQLFQKPGSAQMQMLVPNPDAKKPGKENEQSVDDACRCILF